MKKRERVLTLVEKVSDWNLMREEIGLKRETLELWRIGREKGREDMVVDMANVMATTPKPKSTRNLEIDRLKMVSFSPFHSNQAIAVIERLLIIGMEPKLIPNVYQIKWINGELTSPFRFLLPLHITRVQMDCDLCTNVFVHLSQY